jgi:hypothetical protein
MVLPQDRDEYGACHHRSRDSVRVILIKLVFTPSAVSTGHGVQGGAVDGLRLWRRIEASSIAVQAFSIRGADLGVC